MFRTAIVECSLAAPSRGAHRARGAGIAALQCPQCGAGLQPTGGPLVECAYCRTVAFIPPRARPRDHGRLVLPTVFWVAFHGPSPERVDLETPKAPGAASKMAKAAGFFGRGLSPLPGIELAERAPGIDVKQWLLTIALTALALGVGYLLLMGLNAAS
jgi:hypothetical protein